jgi:voltage-gated potassium channel
MTLLINVIRQEAKPMLSALVMILILMLFSASGIYWLEKDIQPDVFGSMPAALWWVVVTLSTVGSGDVIPVTPLGKLLGSTIMILGVGMVALPAGMLASRFTDTIHRQQEQFKNTVLQSLFSEDEGTPDKNSIEHYRQELFISRVEAEIIIANCLREQKKQANFCPKCGEKIHTIED